MARSLFELALCQLWQTKIADTTSLAVVLRDKTDADIMQAIRQTETNFIANNVEVLLSSRPQFPIFGSIAVASQLADADDMSYAFASALLQHKDFLRLVYMNNNHKLVVKIWVALFDGDECDQQLLEIHRNAERRNFRCRKVLKHPERLTDQQFGDYFSNLSDDCKLAFLEVHPQHWGMFIETVRLSGTCGDWNFCWELNSAMRKKMPITRRLIERLCENFCGTCVAFIAKRNPETVRKHLRDICKTDSESSNTASTYLEYFC